MPTLKIGDKRVKVDDSFLQLSPEDQAATVEEIAAGLGVQAEAPPAPAPTGGEVSAPNLMKAGLRGIPVLGGLMNKAAAGIDAATQPMFGSLSGSQAPSMGERYAANLAANEQNEKAFNEQSPIASTVAQVGGGVGALLPAAATKVGAKLLGLSGSLPGMVTRGAASGAALTAADAAVRGEDPVHGAEVGGVVGGAMPLAGRLIGEGVRAARRVMTPAAAPVAQNNIRVGNVEVPMTQSQMTGDAAQSAEEQILARGGRGEAAQRVAEDFRAAQRGALQQADDGLTQSLAPGGAVRTTPQAAAEAVSTELSAAARAAAAAQQARTAAAAQEGTDIAAAVGGGRTVADAPYAAAEITGAGVRRAAEAARTARTQAYQAARDAEIEVAPAAFDRMPTAIVRTLQSGDDRVRLNERTPAANEALQLMRRGFGATDREAPPMQIGADGRPMQRNVTGTDIDEMRKDLIALQRQANDAARGPGGDRTDVRAMQRILTAFDDHVENAVGAGTLRGDGQEFLNRLREARRLHREYRQTFSPRDPQDEVGKVIEKIIGRGADREALPNEVVDMAFGPANNPGGAKQVRVANRLRDIFGADSREWAAHKQGLLAHVTEAPAGRDPYTPEQVAQRMDAFLNGDKGRGLAEAVFSPAERQRLGNYAAQVRASAPAPRPVDTIERVMQRISGADGQLPAPVNEIVGYLYGPQGMGGKTSVDLAHRLKRELTPESWDKVRQGLFAKLTDVPEGMITKKEQALSQQLHKFLNGDGKQLSEAMFTQRERDLIRQMATAYKQMIPVEGTTNPSGTAPMLAKIAAKAQSVLLPLLGFSQGGMTGAAMGVAAQRGIDRLVTKAAAKDATKRFYGEQPRAAVPPVRPSRVPTIAGQGAAPALTE